MSTVPQVGKVLIERGSEERFVIVRVTTQRIFYRREPKVVVKGDAKLPVVGSDGWVRREYLGDQFVIEHGDGRTERA